MSHRLHLRNRTDASLARHHGRRQRGRSVLFGCEGETEIEYLRVYCQTLKLNAVFPKATTGLDPLSIVDRTLISYDDDFDLVVCVFDQDDHTTFEKARHKIATLANKKRGRVPVIEAISKVAFEVWILLHLEQTDRPFSSAGEIISYIQKNHIPDYDKSRAVELLPMIEIARTNADWLDKRYKSNGQSGSMTTMHLLIKRLRELARLDISEA